MCTSHARSRTRPRTDSVPRAFVCVHAAICRISCSKLKKCSPSAFAEAFVRKKNISLFSQHTKSPFVKSHISPMTPTNNDNTKVADDTGGGFTFGSTAAPSSAPAFTFNGGSGGASTPNPFSPSFHLWDHLLDNEDVFARVLAFLNPTERKFCT